MAYYFSKDLMWWRIHSTGFGFIIRRTPPLFSERMGYVKALRLPFGWRVSILDRVS